MSGTDEFHHGVRSKRVDNTVGPVEIDDTNTVGMNLTAPDADASLPRNEPFLIFKSDTEMRGLLGETGTAKKYTDAFFQRVSGGVIAVNIFEEGVDQDATLVNAIGDQASQTGLYALEASEGHVHVRPKILMTPEYTSVRVAGAANPLAIAQGLVANSLRAVHVTSGPNTTDEDAIAFREDFDDPRMIIFDPHIKELGGVMGSEAHVAAAGVMTDKEVGFHASWGNKLLNTLGVTRVLPYTNDPDSRVNNLLKKQVNTIINYDGGWRTWGDYAATADTDRLFYCQTRVEDVIDEGLSKICIKIISDPMVEDKISAALESIQQFLDALANDKKIYGGRADFKGERNAINALQLGKIALSYDAYSPPPITQINLEFTKNSRYLEREVQSLIARSSFANAA